MATGEVGKAHVTIGIKTDKFKRGLARASKMMKAFAKKMAAVAKKIALASAAAVTAIAIMAIKAFATQQKAEKMLEAAIVGLGQATDDTLEDLKEFAAGLQQITVHGDETLLSVMALGINLGKLSGDALKDATEAAIGLATILDIDLKTSMQLIARAAAGQFTLFTRYGIALAHLNTDQEKWAELMKIGQKGFKQSQAEALTLAGKWQQVLNAWGDAFEGIGQKGEGPLNDLLDKLLELATEAPVWIDAMAEAIPVMVSNALKDLQKLKKFWDNLTGISTVPGEGGDSVLTRARKGVVDISGKARALVSPSEIGFRGAKNVERLADTRALQARTGATITPLGAIGRLGKQEVDEEVKRLLTGNTDALEHLASELEQQRIGL